MGRMRLPRRLCEVCGEELSLKTTGVFHRACGPGPTHGIASTYRNAQYACRCEPCRRANTEISRRERAARELKPVPDHLHGTANAYFNYSCRCDPCKKAGSIENSRRSMASQARQPS